MVSHPHGAMIFSIMTLSIMTLCITGLLYTKHILCVKCHYAECRYAKCRNLFIDSLNVDMQSVTMQMSLCRGSWHHHYCHKFKIVIFCTLWLTKSLFFLNLSSFCEKDIYQMSQIFASIVIERMTVVGKCRNTFKLGSFEFKLLYLESTA